MENNESRTETGFLHLYFLTVSIIICYKCIYLSWQAKSMSNVRTQCKVSISRLPLMTAYTISHQLFTLYFSWSWANRNADYSLVYIVLKCRQSAGLNRFLGSVEGGLVGFNLESCFAFLHCLNMDFIVVLIHLQPFEEASLQAREQFKVDLQHYQAQLTPAQLQQQSVEKRQKMAQRKAIRKKRVREEG